MEARERFGLSRLEQLPNELKHIVLANVQDIFSLRSAVLSCRSLYAAFLSVETSLTTRVLVDHIVDPVVLLDAIARYRSLSINPLEYKTVEDFIETYYSNIKSVEELQWNLRSALSIAKYHQVISYYTDSFVSKTGNSFPDQDFSPSQPQMPVTPTEVRRIQRAFYRYEIFCNIFRNPGHSSPMYSLEDFGGMKLQDIFLSKFAPWENEQLACAYTFLVDELSPIYDEMAEHDVEWGSREIEWGPYGITEESGWFQFMLGIGLERLKDLLRAETSAQQKKLMPRWPLWRYEFIRKAFKRINGMGRLSDDTIFSDTVANCDTSLEDLTAEEESTYVTAPLFVDPDPGPARVWAWASRQSIPFDFVNSRYQKPLQGWGYVMWDFVRLCSLSAFQEPFKYPVFDLHESRRQRREKEQYLVDVERSHDTRKQIYESGGTGWWSKDDQSQVIWTSVVKR